MDNKTFKPKFEEIQFINRTLTDHDKLNGRDKVNQHPINAITGLAEFLQTIQQDSHFIFLQKTASAEWLIVHDLDKYPSVTVVDSAGSVVVGDIEYISKNTIKVTFGAPFSGKAYLN